MEANTIHLLFDFLAWTGALGMGIWLKRRKFFIDTRSIDLARHPHYFTCLGLGALAGGILFGSWNMHLGQTAVADYFQLGHSIAGALVGGIVGVELYKKFHCINTSTGIIFVAPLAFGIAIGRLGCFFAGLDDYTYGVETTMPWGVDFGDGIHRHPVQLYESGAMILFLTVFFYQWHRRTNLFLANGFYLFVLFYAAQRFMWEFLKPYPPVIWGLNLFHLICLGMILYAVSMVKGRCISHA